MGGEKKVRIGGKKARGRCGPAFMTAKEESSATKRSAKEKGYGIKRSKGREKRRERVSRRKKNGRFFATNDLYITREEKESAVYVTKKERNKGQNG